MIDIKPIKPKSRKNLKKNNKKLKLNKNAAKEIQTVEYMETDSEPANNTNLSTIFIKEELSFEPKQNLSSEENAATDVLLTLPKNNEQLQEQSLSYLKSEESEPTTKIKTEIICEDKNDILLSFLDLESQDEREDVVDDPENELNVKKEEILSQIFAESPLNPSKLLENEDSSDVLKSLID